MKVFVDTSVWIDYLSGQTTERVKLLSELISSGQPIYSLPVIVQEILQGYKHEKDTVVHADQFEGLTFLPFEYKDAVEAARLYRSMRNHGITLATVDLQIAAICKRHGLHLLTDDKDFLKMSEKIELNLMDA